MSKKQVFSDGITTSTVHFHNDDTVDVHRHQEVNWLDQFRHESESPNKLANGRLAARIPMDLYLSWVREWREKHSDSFTQQTYLAMKINSNEFKHFRNQKI